MLFLCKVGLLLLLQYDILVWRKTAQWLATGASTIPLLDSNRSVLRHIRLAEHSMQIPFSQVVLIWSFSDNMVLYSSIKN